ncbi:MAG: glycosyltransferase family 39 protein [Chloroflexi bacterium]|nr:glycosyltransferase family 39 protein [Chloroflexota bacterium]
MATITADAVKPTQALAKPARTPRYWHLAAALVLLLAGAFLRLYKLDSLPPGMFIDVATNGLDIRDVLTLHSFPVFFPRNFGREALFIYFQALLVAGAGPQPIVFAWASVAMGMLTIALSYRLFDAMFGRWPALFGAALLAFSFWYVDITRFGLRTNSLPPLLVATLYFLWRTLRTGARRYAVFGGITLGLALYTYIASRLLPFLVLALMLAEWRTALKCWRELAMLILISLAVFAPEGVYFVQHRTELLERQAAVSVFNPNPDVEGSHDTPFESILNTAGMYFVRGDENIRHDVPHRPAFDPIQAAFFVAGLGLSLWRARRDMRYRWPLLWLVVMSLPSALSHESPSFFRAVSDAPAACFFPGLALAELGRWRAWAYAIGGGLAVAVGAITFNLYFGSWARNPATYWAYDGNVTRLAPWVAANTQPNQAYFALDHRSTVEFLAPISQTDRWQREESAAIPIPAEPTADTTYLSAPTASLGQIAVATLPGLQLLPHSTAPDGVPDYLAFHWPASAAATFLAARQPQSADMSPDFRLAGSELISNGGVPNLDLFWQPLQPSGPYDLYVHLLAASGKQVAQSDRLVWPVDEGPPKDDLLLTQHSLDVPAGAYTAEIGAVHRSSTDRSQLVGGPIGKPVRIALEIRR